MKKVYKFAIVSIILFIIWSIIPIVITIYINKKYDPEININKTSIISIDCIKLYNVQIKKSTISGNITEAVVCYNKTINITGGKLNIQDKKSSGKTTDNHGFSISANNLSIHLEKNNFSADLSQTKINKNTICSSEAFVYHTKANVVINNFCFDRKNNFIAALNGTVNPKFQIKDYKPSLISFKNLKGNKQDLYIENIKYEDSVLLNTHIVTKNDLTSVNVESVHVFHKRLFSKPITIKNITINNISTNDILFSKLNVIIDNVNIFVDVKNKRIYGNESCQNWLNIVPNELKDGPISQMKLKGTFGFDVQLEQHVSLKINNKCSINGAVPSFIKDLEKPFVYTAYHPDGTTFERTSGPGTPEWIPLDFVSNMATALTITEDPGFWTHRGIIPQALENSLKDDIRLGKFFRGGSTITMQLAKNLWLTRSKSLGRKLQEGILTIALEGGLTKEKILELYLNVIEYGPDTYGIGPGCYKFLKKYPGEITLSEALYMAIRLPSPNKPHSYEASKGFIDKLISIGVASGKISEDELSKELELKEIIEELEE